MAVDMFLKISGVEGEAKDAKHKKEIDVLSWSWGMSQSGSFHYGGGGGTGKVNMQDLSVAKYIDSSSHALALACCDGTHFDEAVLTIRKAGGKEAVEYIIVTMNKVLVTSVSIGAGGGQDRLTENVTLNFATVKFAYQPQDDKGAPEGAAKEMGWNIEENIMM